MSMDFIDDVPVVIIGGGQSGLATGYYLTRCGVKCVILDANNRIGDSWRQRWDSLCLFTEARNSGLPGMAFPAAPKSYPTKDEVAAYLERYADRFDLPVRTGMRVRRVARDEGEKHYRIETDEHTRRVEQVVVATGSFQRPAYPGFAGDLANEIKTCHTAAYQSPADFGADAEVLVVGAGNAGVEIAREVATSGRRTLLAGPSVGSIPIWVFNSRVFWWLATTFFTSDSMVTRHVARHSRNHGDPLVRYSERDATRVGVKRVSRVTGVDSGHPVVEGDRLDVSDVVWATGYEPDFGWLDLPGLEFKDDGHPIHERGIVPGEPGLYFVGLPYQTTLVSASLGGVGIDAAHITSAVANHSTTTDNIRI